ncbi:hypothetical protein Pmani_015939 [Petrolisthes manimaculis]|uniref:Uncharacterized protein n=1 Tax=Petrolisthes manimaculis TaxID=1843537 RepID=A0AAE1PSQ6_9EUCA|nr:hypothetical protein Pmani_015939 [Petrolisthes manimaculis]
MTLAIHSLASLIEFDSPLGNETGGLDGCWGPRGSTLDRDKYQQLISIWDSNGRCSLALLGFICLGPCLRQSRRDPASVSRCVSVLRRKGGRGCGAGEDCVVPGRGCGAIEGV